MVFFAISAYSLVMNIVAIQRLILLKHTLFGMTWLAASALLPYLQKEAPQFELRPWLLLTLAFTSARFSGMCFNSYFDRSFDAKNPRTKNRPLPQGEISPRFCALQALLYLAIFLWASWAINSLCSLLSLAVGVSVVLYSLTKRISPLCHFALGFIYFFAPFCAWAALTGEISPSPFFFGLACFFTISASDIIYACQDVEFDRTIGLYSIPALFDIKRALSIAALLHACAVGALYYESFLLDSTIFTISCGLIASIMAFCYMKLLLGQLSYMAVFTRINISSGTILLCASILELGLRWRAL